ncbi:MAG: CvpA family protein [Clostridia bacterium]|nr:CvpA family protein [Clostridia bacterium]
MTIALVDIILIAFAAIFMIIGLVRGFFKSVISLVATVAAAILACLFADTVIALLNDTFDITVKVGGLFEEWIGKITPEFNTVIPSVEELPALIESLVTKLSLPNVLLAPITKAITNVATSANIAGKSVATLIGPMLAGMAIKGVVILVLFLLIRLVIYLVETLINKTLLKLSLVKFADRVLGMAFGLLQSALIVLLVFTLVPYVAKDPDSAFRQQIEQSQVGGWIYEHNPIPRWIAEGLDFEQILDEILHPNGKPSEAQESDLIGTWKIQSVTFEGTTYGLGSSLPDGSILAAESLTFTFAEGGTGQYFDGEGIFDFTWQKTDSGYTLTPADQPARSFTFTATTLTVQGDNMTHVFSK